MGIKVKDSGIRQGISRVAKRTNKAALRELRKGGRAIETLSKEMAPVDEGYLEQSITYQEKVGGKRRRKKIDIFVDESIAADGKSKVGDYATLVHEGVDKRYGEGPRSKAKADALGVEVGPFFMTRAVEELEDEIAAKVKAALKKALK